MPASDARDVATTVEADQPSPNDVSGFYDRDPDDSRKYLTTPEHWNPPVDPSGLDPEQHRAVVPYEARGEDAALSVPLADLTSPVID